ncbi:hypothetical protein MAR_022707 [Mya arenaria]|uniref:Uncharacterized protein n=1 Tax=Mya arenaria TaxID=6604 RepID=A0ABY7DLU3_MYAAR|nr:hypothetical protein MAR_022707 [Mya arenaria]
MSTGVTREDIRRANDEIGGYTVKASKKQALFATTRTNGRNQSPNMGGTTPNGKIDFDPADWAESRHVVDAVMELLLTELRSQAEANYKGLRIDSYVRQGSSREGMKVIKADEFDAMLEFHFDGLESKIEQTEIKNSEGFNIQGHCFLEIRDVDMAYLRGRYPTLYAKSSMLDTAIENINTAIDHHNRITSQMPKFGLRRKMNPPSVNVKINLKGGVTYDEWGGIKTSKNREIDLDFVPAFLMRRDQTTRYEGALLQCPIHAICKWAEEDSHKALEFVDQDLKWDVKSI